MALVGVNKSFLLLPLTCWRRWRTKGSNAMNDTTIGLETEQEILTHEISDEALETAGTEIAGNYTMFCSGIQRPG